MLAVKLKFNKWVELIPVQGANAGLSEQEHGCIDAI